MKIIIVHANERSLKKSIKIAEEQGEVHLVSEKPFHKSLRKAFEMALDWDCFTLIGGDQYLYEGAIDRIDELLDESIFRMSFHGWDHLYQMKRLMAPCVYQSKFLKEILSIDASQEIRPESYIRSEMRSRGYEDIIHPDTLAIHDKDQYYRDIYRKGVFSAAKSMPYIKNNGIINILKASKNMDYKVFLAGINDGINNNIRPVDEILKQFNLTEKCEL